MKRSSMGISLVLFAAFACRADVGDVRCLEEVYSHANTVVYGAVVSADTKKCGGRDEVSTLYVLRVSDVVKGDMKKGNIRVCTHANMLLSNYFIVAGDQYGKDEIVAEPDAAVLAFSRGRFYRVLSYDSPIYRTSKKEVYAVGELVPDFMDRFHYLFRDVVF